MCIDCKKKNYEELAIFFVKSNSTINNTLISKTFECASVPQHTCVCERKAQACSRSLSFTAG